MAGSKRSEVLPEVLRRLREAHPDARYELDWETPLQLLVATILAAQCTDERVNAVTRPLFRKYRDARSFADADPAELEEAVRPTGFYKNKARAIRDACRALVDRHGGDVPTSMDEMTRLPGVARKTANVVLNAAYGIPSGVVVDTHVARVSRRLGLTAEAKPERIEAELIRILDVSDWIAFGPAMVLHGRYTCTARAPRCGQCILKDVCERIGVEDASVGGPGDEPARPAARARRPRINHTPEGDPMSPDQLPESWQSALSDEFAKPYFRQLQGFVAKERAEHQVFPPEADVFNAYKLAPFDRVKVLLIGQDPYHDDNQAHGLCFSVRSGIKPPPSLVNMFKELKADLGCKVPNNGHLVPWAEQGVMLLNAVLTVRAHEPNSHKDRGWETFTDATIRALNDRDDPVVFMLWGAYAQKKGKLVDPARHTVLTAAHPSPLSAKKFFGSRPFSAVNAALEAMGKEPIDWQLPDI